MSTSSLGSRAGTVLTLGEKTSVFIRAICGKKKTSS